MNNVIFMNLNSILGKRYVMMEMKVALAKIVHKYEIFSSLAHIDDYDFEFCPFVRVKGGVKIRLEGRRSQVEI